MISIIIPCYNVAENILITIQSILRQKCSNFEIIAVNDGSEDSTLDVLNGLAKNDTRIKVINQPNRGVAAARNKGLEHASGEWIYFLDGDDEVSAKFSDVIEKITNSDVILFRYIVKKNGKIIKYSSLSKVSDPLKAYLTGRIDINMCSAIYNAAFLRHHSIKFDENTAYSEDREFIIKALYCAVRIEYFSHLAFHYLLREGSAMSENKITLKRITSLTAIERCWSLLQKTKYEPFIRTYLKTSIYLIIIKAKRNKADISPEACSQLLCFLRKYCGKFTNIKFNRYWMFSHVMDIACKLHLIQI